MNLEEANDLLTQICAFNKIFFEEHLGIRWELPNLQCLVDSNLESLQRSDKSHPNRNAVVKKKNDDRIDGKENKKMLQLAFEVIRGSMSYLMDTDLPEIVQLCDMTDRETKLAQLDNVFSVSRSILPGCLPFIAHVHMSSWN